MSGGMTCQLNRDGAHLKTQAVKSGERIQRSLVLFYDWL